MPEISESEYRELTQYKALGSPSEVGKKITDLEADNHRYREERRRLKEEQAGKVLVEEKELNKLRSFAELGELDEVKTRLQEGAQAREELKAVQARSAALQFAKAVGLADESVETMVAIPGLKDASFEVRTRKQKNEKGEEVEVQVGYVKLPDSEKAMSFEDAKEVVPALRGLRVAEPEQGSGGSRTQFIRQSGNEGEGDPKAALYERIRKEEAERAAKAAQKDQRVKSLEERMGMART